MINKIKIFFATIAAILFCGCGHNAIQFSDGIGFDAGVDPEHFSASFNLRYGKILSVAVRDNAEIEMTGAAQGGQEASDASTSTSSGIKIKIGRQINGYTVEALKALNERPATSEVKPLEDEIQNVHDQTEAVLK